jgi:hypothetical protein
MELILLIYWVVAGEMWRYVSNLETDANLQSSHNKDLYNSCNFKSG